MNGLMADDSALFLTPEKRLATANILLRLALDELRALKPEKEHANGRGTCSVCNSNYGHLGTCAWFRTHKAISRIKNFLRNERRREDAGQVSA